MGTRSYRQDVEGHCDAADALLSINAAASLHQPHPTIIDLSVLHATTAVCTLFPSELSFLILPSKYTLKAILEFKYTKPAT